MNMGKGALLAAAVFAALLSMTYEASTAPAVPAALAAPGPAPIALNLAPVAEGAPALAIREAHSDGGYWYWQR
jgi:hypothetical protein